MAPQSPSLQVLQKVIDSVDVGECPLKVQDVCLDGSSVVLIRSLGPSGKGWSQSPTPVVRGGVSFPLLRPLGSVIIAFILRTHPS